jgi:hypothetical protein
MSVKINAGNKETAFLRDPSNARGIWVFFALLRERFLASRIRDRFTADFMLLARPCWYCGSPIPVARLVGAVGSAIGAAVAL